MATQTGPQPLDGEIIDMRDPAGAPGAAGLRDDAEVVGFEAVTPDTDTQAHGSRAWRQPPDTGVLAAGADGLAMLRAQPAGAEDGATREHWAGRWLKTAGFVCAGAAFWVNGGHALFIGPSSAPDLVIADVTSRLETRDGQSLVRVDTRVENRGSGTAQLPTLVVSVHGRDGSTTRYKLGTSRNGLGPGASHLFSGHVAAPNVGVDRVSVRLANAGSG
ncbi:hypothetical protein CSC94_18280 [Zhengella mangrovi]|uniref:Uncharacterized protein n=1 Tax=Zhengella mangrovi TaxID=1982044 RepID=A0A2G1QJ56_9HYPH|nr:hypothetical protein [Zhengella mangrovi]PHP65542.1 hypothetical protein CSC94_18280 [Zhengella mangrovi]